MGQWRCPSDKAKSCCLDIELGLPAEPGQDDKEGRGSWREAGSPRRWGLPCRGRGGFRHQEWRFPASVSQPEGREGELGSGLLTCASMRNQFPQDSSSTRQ